LERETETTARSKPAQSRGAGLGSDHPGTPWHAACGCRDQIQEHGRATRARLGNVTLAREQQGHGEPG